MTPAPDQPMIYRLHAADSSISSSSTILIRKHLGSLNQRVDIQTRGSTMAGGKKKGSSEDSGKGGAIPEGDLEKGKALFKQRCAQCHVVDSLASKQGPTLNGIISRTSGTVAGFDYSASNKSKGVVWSRETLFEYLADPKKYIPGTKMVFAGLKKADERAYIIKYLEVEGGKPPSK